MADEIVTPQEMATIDAAAIDAGPFDGHALMRNAGRAVAAEILRHCPNALGVDVLCGPGNNGGDGYVAARVLAEAGCDVRIWAEGAPLPGSDAARAALDCPVAAAPLADFSSSAGAVAVDALYGAGLSRALSETAARAAALCASSGAPVVAVDLPSGVSGASGHVAGAAFSAALTVTFVRRKPGHLLLPGRALCGEVTVADIGIPDAVVAAIGPRCAENRPAAWLGRLPSPAPDTHKYRRGHAVVLSGGPNATGAARLAAIAGARAGAGAVTLLSPGAALAVNAAHLTSIMLARVDTPEEAVEFVVRRKASSAVIGPGFGSGGRLRATVLALLAVRGALEGGVVLDADALTAFEEAPDALFAATAAPGAPPAVLTPHEGEFARLFPDIAAGQADSKLERARAAATWAGAAVVCKGPDTVIASPDGRAAIDDNGTPWLATAGSGDVLSGIVAGLLAQRMPAFEAACAAVWMHGEAGRRFGPGLIAEDLPGLVPPVLGDLLSGRL